MPDRPALPPALQHSRRATLYLFVGFLASLMPMPYSAVAVVPLVASLVESVLALRAMKADGVPASVRRWTGAGIAITGLLLVTLLAPYAFWGATRDYQNCLDGANTDIAKAACKTTMLDKANSIENFLHRS